jgi:hypothetical protein
MKKMFLFILVSSFSLFASENPKVFDTDFCTAYPEGTRERPELWKHCCLEHDLYFWAGGSRLNRNLSDERLRDCVFETGAEIQAHLIYLGVTMGSLSPIKFKTKIWGNAWMKRARYSPLSLKERELLIQQVLSQWEIPRDLAYSFIEQISHRRDLL